MDKTILNTEIQQFITHNLKSDISAILLKGIPFENLETKTIIEQIEAKKRSEKKLPTWFQTKNIYYPNKLNIEQTSSEITAKYKAHLASGNSLIDLTGGFGVDAYYFAKKIKTVTHCEINTILSEIVRHNFEVLKAPNISCLNKNGIDALKQIDRPFDWVYIDPSRRDDSKNKVFLLSDCLPNVKTFQGLFLKYAKNVMIKTSPLLDIKATQNDLDNIKELHIVAVNNEVKELLWVLERDYKSDLKIKTINITKTKAQTFNFIYQNEANTIVEYSEPLTYLYEPNSAILKSGAFQSVGHLLNVYKLHRHSHLYTTDVLIDFPGRRFKVEKVIAFNKKIFAKEKIDKANVTVRNFPLSVSQIRKKLNIKGGGAIYLFFTTDQANSKIIIKCSKIN